MASTATDLELVISNYIRNHYEHKYKQNVPMALKYLTLQFSNKIIGCRLLTMKQDMEFFKMLSTKLPSIRRFNFLFRASDHKYSAAKFHKYCDNKGGTITIITSHCGNIFGGYTSISWNSNGGWLRDEKAFLFLIKSDDKSIQIQCPLLFELRKDDVKSAIYCKGNCGPIFGWGYDIFIDGNRNGYTEQYSYNTPKVKNLCGDNRNHKYFSNRYLFQVMDYEVFKINLDE